MAGRVRAGMGGWVFPPWRGLFYPEGVKQKDELAFASRKVTAIEINATYHSLQSPASFARWAAETPDDFRFAIKGSRYCTNRRELALAGEAVERFFSQGMDRLGQKLGPILWQFMPNKKFSPQDFEGFLGLLPTSVAGLPLRHCLEVRNATFADPAFAALCRARGVAICMSDGEGWPLIDEATADFAYARLTRGQDDVETCYPDADLDLWAARFAAQAKAGRDVFAFLISGGKQHAPAGAVSLLERIDRL